MNMRVAAARPVVPPPIPLPTVTDIEPVEFDDEPVLEPAAIDGDALSQGDEALGLEDGDGEGDGGTAEEGLFRNTVPVPRSVMPPQPPDDRRLRGAQVEVWVFVDTSGRVVPDSTQLRPPTRNRAFNRSLIRTASEWSFDPALRDGKPVASWFTYRYNLGG
jgi:TonB family protein